MTADDTTEELVETGWAAREAAAVLGSIRLGRPVPVALRDREAKLRESGHVDDTGVSVRGLYLWSLLADDGVDPISHAKYVAWDKDTEITYPFQNPEPPVTAGRYLHFKGGIYTVTGIATDTETEEQVVVYTSENGRLWTRRLAMFTEEVSRGGYTGPRFQRLPEEG